MKNSNDTIENRSRDPPVCSAVPQPLRHRVPPNRNEYQEYFVASKDGWCVGLTTLPPPCADCNEICEPQPAGTLWICPGL
jgi:hypothetical protein